MNSTRSSRSSKRAGRRSRSKGIALVSVLWLLLLLSGMAATVSYVARVQALEARRTVQWAQIQAAEDAAIVDTFSMLSDAQTNRHPLIGASHVMEFAGIPLTVTVENEAGRIDLNAASNQLLIAFLESQDVDADRAVKLVEALREYQGSQPNLIGPDIRVDAASQVHDERAELRNPLRSVDELLTVPAWSSLIQLPCWMDSFTVYSAQTTVALKDADPRTRAAVLTLRKSEAGDSAAPAEHFAASEEPKSLLGEVFRIEVQAQGSGGLRAEARWIGRLTGDPDSAVLTLRWDHDLNPLPANCAHES